MVLINKGKSLHWVMSCCISSGLSFSCGRTFSVPSNGDLSPKMLPVCRPSFASVATPVRPRGFSVNWSVVVL